MLVINVYNKKGLCNACMTSAWSKLGNVYHPHTSVQTLKDGSGSISFFSNIILVLRLDVSFILWRMQSLVHRYERVISEPFH